MDAMHTITQNDILYKVERTLKDEHVNKIDEWEDVLLKLYNGDKIFKKDGVLYIVSVIDDVVIVEEDVVTHDVDKIEDGILEDTMEDTSTSDDKVVE